MWRKHLQSNTLQRSSLVKRRNRQGRSQFPLPRRSQARLNSAIQLWNLCRALDLYQGGLLTNGVRVD
ncbi:hypothetical protein VTK56DRAFT_4814 [Thermocarpiscus australiensis]